MPSRKPSSTSSSNFKCQICGVTFNVKRTYLSHLKKCSNQNSVQLKHIVKFAANVETTEKKKAPAQIRNRIIKMEVPATEDDEQQQLVRSGKRRTDILLNGWWFCRLLLYQLRLKQRQNLPMLLISFKLHRRNWKLLSNRFLSIFHRVSIVWFFLVYQQHPCGMSPSKINSNSLLLVCQISVND